MNFIFWVGVSWSVLWLDTGWKTRVWFPTEAVWDQPTSCWVGAVDCGYVLKYVHTYIHTLVHVCNNTYIIHSFLYSLIHFLDPEWQISHRMYRPFRTCGNIKFITISHEVCWEYSSQNTDPTIRWHSVMFPTETFEMGIVL